MTLSNNNQAPLYAMGLMSGTSMDGVDVALITSDGLQQVKSLVASEFKYPRWLQQLMKAAEFTCQHYSGNIKQVEQGLDDCLDEYLVQRQNIEAVKSYRQQLLSELEKALCDYEPYRQYEANASAEDGTTLLTLTNLIRLSTWFHIQAVQHCLQQHDLDPSKIDVIGYHGQTLYHNPSKKITLQIGYGEVLAKVFSIPVVYNFRENDVKHGGQGAPFAPIYHLALANQGVQEKIIDYPTVMINCGGIANVTMINDAEPEHLIGFDTGPGNALLDRFVSQKTQGKEHFDQDGSYAKQGQVNKKILQHLWENSCGLQQQNYYELPLPKSLDINDLRLDDAIMKLSLTDGCATLAAFTLDTILQGLALAHQESVSHFVLAGGGWNNPVLKQGWLHRTQQHYPNSQVHHASELGWDSDTLEAEIFAYLAIRSLKKYPLSYPNTTGVPKPISGGNSINLC